MASPPPVLPEGVRNALELQMFGLRRSGNHAVIAWLAQQYRSPIVFLNSVRPFCDPYSTYMMGRVPNAVPRRKLASEEIETLRAAPKHLLLISYEDLNLRKLAKTELLGERETWVGKSERAHRLILLRDFYNWLASRVRLFESKSGHGEHLLAKIDQQIRLWLVYAREFAGETAYLGSVDAVRVQFDRWSGDEAYRLQILDRLGIDVLNNSRSIVPHAGGGSSFDGTRFSGSAEEMNLMDRWSHLELPEYRPLLALLGRRRSEIDRYNSSIFGLEYPFSV